MHLKYKKIIQVKEPKINFGSCFCKEVKFLETEELRLKLAGLTRRSFILDVLKEAQSFEIQVERIDAYIGMIYLYIKSQKTVSTNVLSERQEICSANAINNICSGNLVQALHEIIDVLDNYGSTEPLSYNEYVLINNLILLYNNIRKV